MKIRRFIRNHEEGIFMFCLFAVVSVATIIWLYTAKGGFEDTPAKPNC